MLIKIAKYGLIAEFGLTLFLANVGGAVDFDPKWHLPAFSNRVVFTTGGGAGACALVELRRENFGAVGEKTAMAACDSSGSILPHAVVFSDRERVCVLVGLNGEDKPKEFVLYFGDGAPMERRGPEMRDPLPVRLEIFRASVNNVPNSWPKMLYLLASAGPCAGSQRRADFGQVKLDADGDAEASETRRRGRGGQRWIVRLSSYALCAGEGEYRFAVDCRDAGFLLVDGEMAVEWPGEHRAGEWKVGPAVRLAPGPHRIEVINSCRGISFARIGWIPPGGKGVASLPQNVLLTSFDPLTARVESATRSLHPAFVFETGQAYGFKDCGPSFIPVEFRSATRNWISGRTNCRWSFGDGTRSEGDAVRHLFTAAARFKVTLEVRDELGFADRCEGVVDLRFCQPFLYLLRAAVTDLPAVAYENDAVAPVLRVEASSGSSLPLDVEWEMRTRSGSVVSGTNRLSFRGAAASQLMWRGVAGDADVAFWSVLHGGTPVATGVVRFARWPFSPEPVRVAGDGLVGADGARIVLVPRRYVDEPVPPSAPARRDLKRVVFVDDGLMRPSASGSGVQESPFSVAIEKALGLSGSVSAVRIPGFGARPDAYGHLVKLEQVPALAGGGDVLVLALGREDMEMGISPESFERTAAALTDLAMAGGSRVVWVTMPPFRGYEETAREYAVAVRRVADARAIQVADFHTLCRAASRPGRFFDSRDSGALSPWGRDSLARLTAGALGAR